MDDLLQQLEEIEALKSIYDSKWKEENETSGLPAFSIEIVPNVKLFVTLPSTYPSTEPPRYELLAPYLNLEQKKQIREEFNNIYINSDNSPIVFQWIEKLKEFIANSVASVQVECPSENVSVQKLSETKQFNIIHGEIIQDRKSIFQGHTCKILNQEDVKKVMDCLLENRKIAQATHNIIAYRIITSAGLTLQDFDDDGENHAGSRLLHLLQILDVKNVIVIVTRWYGGIHLGPDRFRHINNAARQVLTQSNFI